MLLYHFPMPGTYAERKLPFVPVLLVDTGVSCLIRLVMVCAFVRVRGPD